MKPGPAGACLWSRMVGKEEKGSAATGSRRLWLLWGLPWVCQASWGCRTRTLPHHHHRGLPGQAQSIERVSLAFPQLAGSGAPGRRRPQPASSSPYFLGLCSTRSAPSILPGPGRDFRAGPDSSQILVDGLGLQPQTASMGA